MKVRYFAKCILIIIIDVSEPSVGGNVHINPSLSAACHQAECFSAKDVKFDTVSEVSI